jgi:hypothetical protein
VKPIRAFKSTKNSRIHLYFFYFWVIAFIPYAIWLRNSIFIVGFISFYAIWVEHLTAYEGAKAKEVAQEASGD